MSRRPLPFVAMILLVSCHASAEAQLTPYNPYAQQQEVVEPVKADGTIQWGTFYKSAAIASRYEQLWRLGACRGTNKDITIPVESNKIVIDQISEGEFSGIVQARLGTLEGGVVQFKTPASAGQGERMLVAQLHPAGVSQVTVTGSASTAILQPGMTVRLVATVDERGRAAEPLHSIDVVTPPRGFVPDAVRPGRPDTVVGTVVRAHEHALSVRVDAGRIRRLTLPLAADSVVNVDASRLELIAIGDAISVKGRLWSGQGSVGDGTVFASRLTVHKHQPADGAGVASR